jgi:hypothetical protein
MSDLIPEDAVMQLGEPEFVATPSAHADLLAQIPEGMPVRLEVDVANNQFRYVALTPEELKQRETDQTAAEVVAAADAQATADRDALVAKLTAGKATVAEVQQALAEVLR